MLAQTLAPLADAGANLQVIWPTTSVEGGDEVFPVTEIARRTPRARVVSWNRPPALLVTGDNQPAVATRWRAPIADQGSTFLSGRAGCRRPLLAVFGFGSDDDASRAWRSSRRRVAGAFFRACERFSR